MRQAAFLIGSSSGASGGGVVKETLRELGVESYWQKVSPLVTEYGVRVAGALLFLLVALYVGGVAARATGRALERGHVERTLARFLSTAVRALVLVLAAITCMSIVGIPVTSFAAMLGAGGLAVGLALQGSLSNIAAGAALSLTRPFRVGDAVVVAGQRGLVDEIGLFTTALNTPDNRRIIIPNGQIFGTIIENITYHPLRRLEIPVGVGYGADIERTRAALLGAVRGVGGIAAHPAAEAHLQGFGDFAVMWEVHVWVSNNDRLGVKDAAIREIKRALDAEGIEIPFPQRVVHMR